MNEEITIIAEQCAKLEKRLQKWAIARDGDEGQARIVVESTTKAIGGFMTEAEAQEFIAAHNGE